MSRRDISLSVCLPVLLAIVLYTRSRRYASSAFARDQIDSIAQPRLRALIRFVFVP